MLGGGSTTSHITTAPGSILSQSMGISRPHLRESNSDLFFFSLTYHQQSTKLNLRHQQPHPDTVTIKDILIAHVSRILSVIIVLLFPFSILHCASHLLLPISRTTNFLLEPSWFLVRVFMTSNLLDHSRN